MYVTRDVAPNQGVYQVSPDGQAVRLPGTEQIVFPNSLAFDSEGNLFVTESFSFDPPLTPYAYSTTSHRRLAEAASGNPAPGRCGVVAPGRPIERDGEFGIPLLVPVRRQRHWLL